jgi:hypothetical protein
MISPPRFSFWLPVSGEKYQSKHGGRDCRVTNPFCSPHVPDDIRGANCNHMDVDPGLSSGDDRSRSRHKRDSHRHSDENKPTRSSGK